MSKKKPRWIVHTISRAELSVIWSAFRFGKQSWGWADDRKIILCDLSEIPTHAHRELRLAAKRIAAKLNKRGVQPAKPWIRDGEW